MNQTVLITGRCAGRLSRDKTPQSSPLRRGLGTWIPSGWSLGECVRWESPRSVLICRVHVNWTVDARTQNCDDTLTLTAHGEGTFFSDTNIKYFSAPPKPFSRMTLAGFTPPPAPRNLHPRAVTWNRGQARSTPLTGIAGKTGQVWPVFSALGGAN